MEKAVYLNLTNIPKELKLIINLLNLDNGKIKFDVNDMDWGLFLQLAFHHRIYPLLYTKLNELDSNIIPDKIVQALAKRYQRNTFKMLQLSAVMEQLSKLFIENQIRPLILKGPVLADDLYGDISLRTCGDLDILVPIEDLSNVNDLLLELGYEKDEYIKTVLNDWKWRHHHYTYYHSSLGIKIEIHWRLNPYPCKEPSFTELWERKRISSITTHPTYYLGKEDLFFFLVLHGARHGWSRLRWLVDIHYIVGQELNWDTIKNQFKKNQCSYPGGQSLILASQLLKTTITKDMQSIVVTKQAKKLAEEAVFYLERMINLHTPPVPKEIAKYHSKHLFSLMSFQQKLLYFLSTLHPYYTDLETMPLPKRLHYLYFPLRPFLLVWRKSRRNALSLEET
jgi:hypothetical protein